MDSITQVLTERFGSSLPRSEDLGNDDFLAQLARRRSHRRYQDRPVGPELIRSLCALAFCTPTKSDLQQRDIIILDDPELRAEIARLFPNDAWIGTAPAFLLFCGNNQRQPLLHDWRGHAFANDHLDAFFNAAVDAAIAMTGFVLAAERVGLGCCPISAVRNHAAVIGRLVGLPRRVFPLAGLVLGWPADEGRLSLRLPLAVTLHENRFSDQGLREQVARYDRRRAELQPYPVQRMAERYGKSEDYC